MYSYMGIFNDNSKTIIMVSLKLLKEDHQDHLVKMVLDLN